MVHIGFHMFNVFFLAGLYTGSLYNEAHVKKKFGFYGSDWKDGSVIVVKSHYPLIKTSEKLISSVHYVILLIRTPLLAITAEFKRQNYNLVFKKDAYSTIKPKYINFVKSYFSHWFSFHDFWSRRNDTQLLLLDYDDIIQCPVCELKRALFFVNVTWSNFRESCLLRDINGKFNRRSAPAYMLGWIDSTAKDVMLRTYQYFKINLQSNLSNFIC